MIAAEDRTRVSHLEISLLNPPNEEMVDTADNDDPKEVMYCLSLKPEFDEDLRQSRRMYHLYSLHYSNRL